jgi:hypothetical protein
VKARWFVIAAITINVIVLAACARQLPAGTMQYSTAFERRIAAGETLPGTDIKYIGKTDQGAQMSIGGQAALKRVLDSLAWHGDAAPGVSIDFNLRVITYDSQSLQAGGTAQVTVSDTNPKAVPESALPKDALTFKGLVTYNVPISKTIPGTTITYEGKTPDGAKLGGIEGYAFRQEADSIVWTGQLADKVFLELGLRLVAFNDRSMRTTGTATLYIKP